MEISEFIVTEKGAVVTKAWNGKEAVETFANAPEGSFDVILMDVMMPVMDGCEAGRQRNPNSPPKGCEGDPHHRDDSEYFHG